MPRRRSLGFQVTRFAMASLARLLPPLGSRWAWTQFQRTPPVLDPVEEDQFFLDSYGNPKTLECEGHTLRVYSMLPPGPARMRVLMLHGWGSRASTMLELAKLLMREGAEVILYDGPSSGLTGSRVSNLPQMLAAVRALHQAHGPFDVAIGHSIGGLVAAQSMADGGLPACKVLVSIGSPNSFETMILRLLAHRWMPESTARFFEMRAEKRLGRPLEDFGIAVSLAPMAAGRLAYLCLHDHSDPEVPVSDAREIERALSWAKVEVSNGLGHNRILRDPVTQKRVLEFVDRALYHSKA